MNCARIEQSLVAYLDGRASAGERREVEAHVASCKGCRTRVEEFRRLWDILDEVPMQEPSPAFDARLRARIAAQPPRPRVWAWLLPSPRLAFTVSLLLLLSVWISSFPPVRVSGPRVNNIEGEFRMIKDLPVLEDYDVLANFEALSEIPPQPAGDNREM